MTRFFHRLFVVAAACLLCGCIQVDDFGDYWDQGFVDNCVNDIVLSDMGSDSKGAELRSIRFGDHTFLMIRDHAGDKGGELIRYDIRDGNFISYALNDQKRDDFLHYYPGSDVVLTTETATIHVLNGKTSNLLSTLANDASYWLEKTPEAYNPRHRTDCTQEKP